MKNAICYAWREAVTDAEMVDLVGSHGGNPAAGWWERVRAHSLGWVSARDTEGLLVGFVNVAWDGGSHAFLLDTATRGTHQRRGIGRELVRQAVIHAEAVGVEWLHVDFEPHPGGRCQTEAYCAVLGHAPDVVVVVADRTPLSDSSSALSGTHPSTCSLRPPFDTTLLGPFYLQSCGFRPTDAGLVHLPQPCPGR